MRKQIFSFLMVAVVTFVSGATVARADLPTAGEFYGNVGVVSLKFEGGGMTDDVNGIEVSIDIPDVYASTLFMAVGKQITDYIAAEFRL